jgi:hypothetical protein
MNEWISVKDRLPDGDAAHNGVVCAINDCGEYWYCIGHYSKDIGWYEIRTRFPDEISIKGISLDFNNLEETDCDDESYLSFRPSLDYKSDRGIVKIRIDGKEVEDPYIRDPWIDDMVVAWMEPEYKEESW